jgi:ketosteroid isomerase-like protein
MSEKLDLVRSIYAAWERGDFGSASWADADIELVFVDGPEPGSWVGVAQMAAVWRRVLSQFDGFRTEGARYRQLADGRVLALTRFHGRAKQSGFDLGRMPSEQAAIFDIRDGKVTGVELAWNADRVLADQGLDE